MVQAQDVARHILETQGGTMSTWKLQKLVFLSQAWHLAWTGTPLFDSRIEAGNDGPIVPELQEYFRGELIATIDMFSEDSTSTSVQREGEN